jgi:hypothetical protein
MAIHQNVLLVEGMDEVRTIPYLIEENGIDWGTTKNPIVFLKDCEGYSNIINADRISTELKADGIRSLGILLDADDQPQDRWVEIREACRKSLPNIPQELPESGLIVVDDNGIRVGIWIMPDNKLPGMLETFLGYLLPTSTSALWSLAEKSINEAKENGAPFIESHRQKAQIHTWLAWQKPPGRQLHQAIQQRILDPTHPEAAKFVAWFRQLYDLR